MEQVKACPTAEMSQNSVRMSWSRKDLNKHLGDIMRSIHKSCVKHGTDPDGYVNYPRGANIAGFLTVANSMMDKGIISFLGYDI